MSHTNGFDRRRGCNRGRSLEARRRNQVPPVIAFTRHDMAVFWAGLMARQCGTRERCAVMFDVTFQTACNWFDGFSCPTGDKVMQAMRWWPEEFDHE
ncbi:hypothetical protein M3484_20910 [Pseudomonas sp. GX19020]|uniref:hypothetical protein n=1 Tax=Pseudomonas sp. GX19020 TaxID=2942277 RepID=UPI002019C110|nr:hypothetical protein [Pseudomonas sp. GX19020]MCL4069022.1 hypothetical protein [Pseudomonas sp. GX19020]